MSKEKLSELKARRESTQKYPQCIEFRKKVDEGESDRTYVDNIG